MIVCTDQPEVLALARTRRYAGSARGVDRLRDSRRRDARAKRATCLVLVRAGRLPRGGEHDFTRRAIAQRVQEGWPARGAARFGESRFERIQIGDYVKRSAWQPSRAVSHSRAKFVEVVFAELENRRDADSVHASRTIDSRMEKVGPVNTSEPQPYEMALSLAGDALAPPVKIFATGWGTMLKRGAKISGRERSRFRCRKAASWFRSPRRLGERDQDRRLRVYITGRQARPRRRPSMRRRPARRTLRAAGRQAGTPRAAHLAAALRSRAEALARFAKKCDAS